MSTSELEEKDIILRQLEGISDQIGQTGKHMDELFDAIAEDRQTLLDDMDSANMQYAENVQNIISTNYSILSETMEKAITPAQLQEFQDALEQNTAECLNLARYVNSVLKDEVDAQLQNIAAQLSAASGITGMTGQRNDEKRLSGVSPAPEQRPAAALEDYEKTFSEQMSRFKEHTASLLDAMQQRNAEDRQTLLHDLDSANRQYAETVQNIMSANCSALSETMEKAITPAQLREFQDALVRNAEQQQAPPDSGQHSPEPGVTPEQLEQVEKAIRQTLDVHLQTISTRLSAVDGAVEEALENYKKDFSGLLSASERRLASAMEKNDDRPDILPASEQQLAAALKDFRQSQKADWEAALRQQQELIRSKSSLDEEKIGKMIQSTESTAQSSRNIADSTRQIQSLSARQLEQLDRSSRRLQEAAEQIWALKKDLGDFRAQAQANDQRLRKQIAALHKTQKRWRRHNLLSSLVSSLFILLILLVISQRPWEQFGMQAFLSAFGAAILSFVLVYVIFCSGLVSEWISSKWSSDPFDGE